MLIQLLRSLFQIFLCSRILWSSMVTEIFSEMKKSLDDVLFFLVVVFSVCKICLWKEPAFEGYYLNSLSDFADYVLSCRWELCHIWKDGSSSYFPRNQSTPLLTNPQCDVLPSDCGMFERLRSLNCCDLLMCSSLGYIFPCSVHSSFIS